MARPLNPRLYHMLEERFGHVKISNEGIAQVGHYHHDRLRNRDVFRPIEPGEYYQVCCPYCNDTRFRLYFNHRWGVRDDEGNLNLWMSICYNENCLTEYDRRRQLYDEMTDRTTTPLERARILKGSKADPAKIVMDWPGPVTRVDKLPENHKAVQYLLSRNFDPVRIGRFYNVHYCHDSLRWLARGRLIIPIYENKVLKGWQARYIGEMNWHRKNAPPKYYTCPGTPRRELLYNLGNASQYRTGVIVEGPTDVWSFGPMACSTLGSTMTNQQQRKFVKAFRDFAAVLLYDPDMFTDRNKQASVEKLVTALQDKFAEGFAVVKLPAGRDPGSLDREFLRDYVAREARKSGVKISWTKR